ncbi:MAG TPA: OmpA family protein, partial [Candidatus Binatia bacterium]|nr:OmpA family protein [Candidatus Binatia bacterium]
ELRFTLDQLQEQLDLSPSGPSLKVLVHRPSLWTRALCPVQSWRGTTSALDKVVPALQQNQMEIDVIGNTDSVPVGPELAERYPTNWELAGERADVIVRYLQNKGVDPSRLRGISAGQYHPVATDDSAAGRKQNRRTDLLLRPR